MVQNKYKYMTRQELSSNEDAAITFRYNCNFHWGIVNDKEDDADKDQDVKNAEPRPGQEGLDSPSRMELDSSYISDNSEASVYEDD